MRHDQLDFGTWLRLRLDPRFSFLGDVASRRRLRHENRPRNEFPNLHPASTPLPSKTERRIKYGTARGSVKSSLISPASESLHHAARSWPAQTDCLPNPSATTDPLTPGTKSPTEPSSEAVLSRRSKQRCQFSATSTDWRSCLAHRVAHVGLSLSALHPSRPLTPSSFCRTSNP
jgi:hypothetical protein